MTPSLFSLFSRAIWWQILGIGSLLLMCAYAGLVIFAYYHDYECDPIKIKVGARSVKLLNICNHN